jgi:lipoate-protein ligase A
VGGKYYADDVIAAAQASCAAFPEFRAELTELQGWMVGGIR